MKSSVFQKLFLSVLLLTSVACSNSSGGSSSGDVLPPADIDTRSCVYEATEGDVAVMENLEGTEIVKASFDKEYNHSLLQGVLGASVVESIPFINQTGATVYKAPRAFVEKHCSRDLFASAKTPPSDLVQEWRRAAGDGTDGVLMGLFLPRLSLPSTKDKAAILVIENGNRWTLVHEFLHHLFMKQAETTGYSDTESQAEYRKQIKAFNAIADSGASNKEIARRVAKMFPSFIKAIDTMLVHFPLEESTIERLMKDEARRGNLKYAPESSNWYLNSSADKAIDLYKALEKIESKIDQENESTIAIREAMKVVTARISEARRLKNEYPEMRNASFEFGRHEDHEGCSRQDETEKMINDLEGIVNKL